MNVFFRLSGAAALLFVAACSPGSTPSAQPPLAGARIGGSFSLTDQNGGTITDRSFAGHYRLVYFGYSFCPDVCPVDLNWLMAGLKRFEQQDPARGARIQPIFVTLDPARDTPAVIGRFAAQFHPRLVALTGSDAAIRDMAGKYLVTYRRVEGSTPGSYLIAHTQLAYLMDPDGRPVALIPVDDIQTTDVNEGEPSLVARELDRWVR